MRNTIVLAVFTSFFFIGCNNDSKVVESEESTLTEDSPTTESDSSAQEEVEEMVEVLSTLK